MQGVGLGGSGSLRKAFFLSEGLSLQQMHGTTSAISVVLGTIATIIRVNTDQITFDLLLPILYLAPIMAISTLFGKKVLKKLDDKTSNVIIVVTLFVTTVLLILKLFRS